MTYAWINGSIIISITKKVSDTYINHEITYEIPKISKKLLYFDGSKIVQKTTEMLDIENQEKEASEIENIIKNSSTFDEFKQKILIIQNLTL